jgi:hypothetical protein
MHPARLWVHSVRDAQAEQLRPQVNVTASPLLPSPLLPSPLLPPFSEKSRTQLFS